MEQDIGLLKSRLEALTGFSIVSIDEFQPLAGSFQGYNIPISIAVNSGNDAKSNEVILQTAMMVIAAGFTLSKKDADTETTVPIKDDSPLRDDYVADINHQNAQILRQPIDVFLLNDMFRQMASQRLGIYFKNSMKIKVAVTRTFKTGASDVASTDAPITINFGFAGYEIK